MKWCELREYKWNEYVTIAVNRNLSNCENSPKKRFSGLQRDSNPQFTSFSHVFPQFTSFHSVFHSFHGLMNSINWPASSVWVFIAQLGEHCSANAEATGSNPVEAPENLFFGLFSQLLKSWFTAMVTYSFYIVIPCPRIGPIIERIIEPLAGSTLVGRGGETWQRTAPGPPGWGLGMGPNTSPRKN